MQYCECLQIIAVKMTTAPLTNCFCIHFWMEYEDASLALKQSSHRQIQKKKIYQVIKQTNFKDKIQNIGTRRLLYMTVLSMKSEGNVGKKNK